MDDDRDGRNSSSALDQVLLELHDARERIETLTEQVKTLTETRTAVTEPEASHSTELVRRGEGTVEAQQGSGELVARSEDVLVHSFPFTMFTVVLVVIPSNVAKLPKFSTRFASY